MTPQSAVLVAFFVMAGGIIAVMLAVAFAASKPVVEQTAVQSKGYALRRVWFWFLGAAALAAFAISLPAFPYASPQTISAAKHFKVVAQQYSFTLPAVVPAQTPIVFDVTAADVNHGFGIYDPAGRLIAQVQAMPLYVNHLALRLTTRGHYDVRCLEYCGIGHTYMHAGFEVK